MDRFKLIACLRRTLGRETTTKGDELVFWCSRGHGRRSGRVEGQLSVNLKTERFHCWSCDFGGKNLLPLLERGSSERREYLAELDSRRGIVRKVEERKYDRPVLPQEFRSLSRPEESVGQRAAMEYLAGRGITREQVLLYKLGYCETGEYQDRIIFPSFDEHGDMNFFVGRAYRGDPRRYKQGNFDKDIITNDCLVDWDRDVILTEGPFDAMKGGTQAIPLNGSLINEDSRLFDKVVRTGVDVYFALDSDVVKKQLNIIKRFLEYGVKSYFVDLAGRKDLGEMEPDEIKHRLAQARLVRNDLDLLRIRVKA
jgi:DNA primase